jgi:hypothetical protein
MYTIVFKYNDGQLVGHACASKKVRNTVLEDVMHHAGEHVAAWRGMDNTGCWDAGSHLSHEHIDTAPQHMRVEWS